MSELSIRRLTQDDVPVLKALYLARPNFMAMERDADIDARVFAIFDTEINWSGCYFFGGYIDDVLIGFVQISRWRDYTNYSVGIALSNPSVSMPRHPDCHPWPLPLVAILNHGIQTMEGERRNTLWVLEPQMDDAWISIVQHPASIAKDYVRTEVMEIPADNTTKVPEALWPVFSPGISGNSRIVKFENMAVTPIVPNLPQDPEPDVQD